MEKEKGIEKERENKKDRRKIKKEKENQEREHNDSEPLKIGMLVMGRLLIRSLARSLARSLTRFRACEIVIKQLTNNQLLSSYAMVCLFRFGASI